MKFLIQEGKTLFVTLPGEIDHYQTPALAEQIDKAVLAGDINCIVFDFANTKFMDSSGIGLLVGRYRKMQSMGGQVYLHNVKGHMAKILQLSGIEKIIGKYEETT